MKSMGTCFALALAVFLLLSNSRALAQEEEPHVYQITTWKTVMPEGGSATERDSLLLEWVNAVLRPNTKILSSKNLRHDYGSDSHDWVVITEYKTWADIEAAGKMSDELFNKKWPDKKQQGEFNRRLGKYFTGHSDEIYRELPKFRK